MFTVLIESFTRPDRRRQYDHEMAAIIRADRAVLDETCSVTVFNPFGKVIYETHTKLERAA